MSKRVLVVAPHPDDEVLGVGGTIARLVDEGHTAYTLITVGALEGFGYDDAFLAKWRSEAQAAGAVLGVTETTMLDYTPIAFDTVPHRQVNEAIAAVFGRIGPDILFIPFNGDINIDHQHIFSSALVAARPNHAGAPVRIYAYETLSETNWNAPGLTPDFIPNVYFDITGYVERKIEAMKKYTTQLRQFPHERSVEVIRALATLRGGTVYRQAAEAFILIREII